MCLYPQLIKNRKYTQTIKNGGIIPPITDPRTLYVPIGCQDCIECRNKKAREWQVRLQEHIKTHTNGKFVGFTLSNQKYTHIIEASKHKSLLSTAKKPIKDITTLKGYERDNEIATQAIRYFTEKWREKFGKTIQHFLVTELGHEGTQNIHLHGIIWTDKTLDEVEKIWHFGILLKGRISKRTGKIKNYVNNNSVNYIVKYITKQDATHTHYKSLILTSHGIGKEYLHTLNARNNEYNPNSTNTTYKTNTGHKISLPIYYRNRIYTDEHRELLWLEQLNKQERYILGNKIDISTKQGQRNYLHALKYAQKHNIQLGYGKGQKNWEKQQYEEQLRELYHQQRIKKGHPPIINPPI